jgi:hypothetical protein
MLSVLNSVLELFKTFLNKVTAKDILYILIILLIGWLWISQVKSTQNIKEEYNTNIIAYTDTISFYKTKNDELVAHKGLFECKYKDLEKLNDSLYTEIKSLKIKNDVLAGVNINGKVEYLPGDTVYIVKQDTISNGFEHKFNFNNEWRTLEGIVNYKPDSLKVNITKDLMNFDYTVAIDDENRLYIKSSNPFVKYNDFTGFTVPKPKKTHFSFGPCVSGGYGLIHQKFDIIVGVSIQWKIFEF